MDLELDRGSNDTVQTLFKDIDKLWKPGEKTKNHIIQSLIVQFISRHGGVAKNLIRYGQCIKAKTEEGWNPLTLASRSGQADVVEKLIQAGTKVETQQLRGTNSLMVASERGHRTVVEALLAADADIHMKKKGGRNALMLACIGGHEKVVHLLIEAGAKIEEQDNDGWSALMLASSNGHTNVVQILLKGRQILKNMGGAKTETEHKNGRTALLWASKDGYCDVVQLLLEYGAKMNRQDKDGSTSLSIASRNGHTKTVEALLAVKADTEIRDKNDWTALMQASHKGNSDVVKLLLHAGAKKDEVRIQGSTSLTMASKLCHTDVVEALLIAKAKMEISDKIGWTALMWASCKGHCDIVQLLLKYGAEINKQDFQGSTSLIIATQKGHTSTVRYLLSAGADKNRMKRDGSTALTMAKQTGYSDIVQLLDMTLIASSSEGVCTSADNAGQCMGEMTGNSETPVEDYMNGGQHGHIHGIYLRNLASTASDRTYNCKDPDDSLHYPVCAFEKLDDQDPVKFDDDVLSMLALTQHVVHKLKMLHPKEKGTANEKLSDFIRSNDEAMNIEWINRPDKEKESMFVVETCNSHGHPVFYGLVADPGDIIAVSMTSVFMYFRGNRRLTIKYDSVEGLRHYLCENVKQENILSELSKHVKACQGKNPEETTHSINDEDRKLLPLSVFCDNFYLKVFRLLATGELKDDVSSQSPPELLETDQTLMMYQDVATESEYCFDRLPMESKYFILITQVIDRMRDGFFPNRCILLQGPADQMSPPIRALFIDHLLEEGDNGPIQVLLTSVLTDVIESCRCFKQRNLKTMQT